MNTAKATVRRFRALFGPSDRDMDAAQVLSHVGVGVGAGAGQGDDKPRVEQVPDSIRIMLDGRPLARSNAALRVVGVGRVALSDPEGASYFLPAEDVDMNRLHPSDRMGRSDWGGRIAYFHLIGPKGLIRDAVWFYPDPLTKLEAIRLHLAFFARSVDEVWVGRQRLSQGADTPQGGWALPHVAERVRPV